MKSIKGHDDQAQDKKLFGKMLKKALPAKKSTADVKGMKKSMKKGMSCGR